MRKARRPLRKGELGAGKTQFAKGIGDVLNVKDIVNSPTYTIINEYSYIHNGKQRVLAHMDTWRLEDDELEKSGLVEHIENGDIILTMGSMPPPGPHPPQNHRCASGFGVKNISAARTTDRKSVV